MTTRDMQDEIPRLKKHPNALLALHPEFHPSVTALADYVGSTTGILSYAEKSDAREFIIGTKNSIAAHLQFKCPDKRFYPLSKDCVCHNMKLTTLVDVYYCVKGDGGEEIFLSHDEIAGARKCIDEMLRLGNE